MDPRNEDMKDVFKRLSEAKEKRGQQYQAERQQERAQKEQGTQKKQEEQSLLEKYGAYADESDLEKRRRLREEAAKRAEEAEAAAAAARTAAKEAEDAERAEKELAETRAKENAERLEKERAAEAERARLAEEQNARAAKPASLEKQEDFGGEKEMGLFFGGKKETPAVAETAGVRSLVSASAGDAPQRFLAAVEPVASEKCNVYLRQCFNAEAQRGAYSLLIDDGVKIYQSAEAGPALEAAEYSLAGGIKALEIILKNKIRDVTIYTTSDVEKEMNGNAKNLMFGYNATHREYIKIAQQAMLEAKIVFCVKPIKNTYADLTTSTASFLAKKP